VTLRRALLLSAGLGGLLGGPDALAQTRAPSDADTQGVAEMLFFTARGLMEAGRYSEACQKFTSAMKRRGA